MEGLDIAMKAFLERFKVDKQGVISARWRDDEELEKVGAPVPSCSRLFVWVDPD